MQQVTTPPGGGEVHPVKHAIMRNGIIQRADVKRPAYPAASSRVARTGSFRTLHSADKLASRGWVLPVSHK